MLENELSDSLRESAVLHPAETSGNEDCEEHPGREFEREEAEQGDSAFYRGQSSTYPYYSYQYPSYSQYNAYQNRVWLYIGNLNPSVDEEVILYKFAEAEIPIAIHRFPTFSPQEKEKDKEERTKYCIVVCMNHSHARKAIRLFNNTTLYWRPMEVMVYNPQCEAQHPRQGNLFVSNLPNSITQMDLYRKFLPFGKILSCYLAIYQGDFNKGWGFVHFQDEDESENAIKALHNKEWQGNLIQINRYLNKIERTIQKYEETKFNNLYVKQLPRENFGYEDFVDLFQPLGEIVSAVLMQGEEDDETPPPPNCKTNRGFGYVCYKRAEDAKKALETIHDKELMGKKIWVSRHYKKVDLQEYKTAKLTKFRDERQKRYGKMNIYIKPLPDNVGDLELRKAMEPFGEVVSAKVMMKETTDEEGEPIRVSKGFGFICFETKEEADYALQQLRGAIMWGKKLYVNIAQLRPEREKIIADQLQYEGYENTYDQNYHYTDTNEKGEKESYGLRTDENQEYVEYSYDKKNYYKKPKKTTGFESNNWRKEERGTGMRRGKNWNQFRGRERGKERTNYTQKNENYYPNSNTNTNNTYNYSNNYYDENYSYYYTNENSTTHYKETAQDYKQYYHHKPQMRPLENKELGNYNQTGKELTLEPQQEPHSETTDPGTESQTVQNLKAGKEYTAHKMSYHEEEDENPYEINQEYLKTLDEEEQRNYLGEKLYTIIVEKESVLASKITGMLLELSVPEIIDLFYEPNLNEKIQEAKDVLGELTK
jgi:RNA recognition motif-containing protein